MSSGGAKRRRASGKRLPEAVSIDTPVVRPSTSQDGSGSSTSEVGSVIDFLGDAEPPVMAATGVTQTTTDPGRGLVDVNLFEGLDASVNVTQSVESQIGFQVPQQLKDKIKTYQYVELSALLSSGRGSGNENSLSVGSGGELFLKSTADNQKYLNIESWTDAMLIFTSIFTAAHPIKCQDLLKYISNIRLGAKQHGGMGWRAYDQQFRLRLAADPARSFAKIDYELWLLFMAAPNSNTTMPQQASKNLGKKCFDFNFRYCSKLNCTFRHACLKCNNDHPSRLCGQGPKGQQFSQSMPQQRPRGPFNNSQPSFRPRFSK